MKRELFFLTILVPGQNYLGRSLNVILQPLIAELQMLWNERVDVYNVSTKSNFNMRATFMWTMSDFPAYEMLT